ncbi:hypothetical protein KRR38_28260 [Novosphingobium sp. G106]|uniref:hypothetical protein n=1 Tax=Novosphingobium sp. G106 TaxID=2849500 RepID=UPI001C2D4A75|nr:hypothetical protein [Novosphingobium sp. G106]MBV1691472.1 hypothetical protein [Novosphingobium sp. G106]
MMKEQARLNADAHFECEKSLMRSRTRLVFRWMAIGTPTHDERLRDALPVKLAA